MISLNRSLNALALISTGIILALVSTGSLVKLLTSLPLGTLEQALSINAAVGLQAGLYLLSCHRSFSSRLITLVLLLISVVATTAFVEMAWQRYQHESMAIHKKQQGESALVQQLSRQLHTVNQELELRINVAHRDTTGNYTTRGLRQLDELAPLRQQADDLNNQLKTLNQPAVAVDASAGSVQALLSESHRFTRLSLFAVIAFLVDVVALKCFSLGMRSTELDEDLVTEAEPMQSPVEQIKRRVIRGDLGNQPSQRQLLEEVKTAFRELIEDGVLVKDGNVFGLEPGEIK